MPFLPSRFAEVILTFAPLFLQQRTWDHAGMLLIGAILAPGQRTVTSLLRIMGLSGERRFVNYHRVLNRAVWSSRAASRLLLGLLITTLMPAGPVVLGLDDTIERRRGKRISAKGIYRDPVRSSKSVFRQDQRVALAEPDALGADPLGRTGVGVAVPDRARALGALLFGVRAAAQDTHGLGAADGVAGPPLAARAGVGADRRQHLCGPGTPGGAGPPRRHLYHTPAPRCCPLRPSPASHARDPRATPDQGPAPAEPLAALIDPATPWQRSRCPWYGGGERPVEIPPPRPLAPCWAAHRADPLGAPPRPPGRFDPQALLCTDLTCDPLQILTWFVQRWPVEVTFRDVRDHLGVETQRQWSDLAIARTTPCFRALLPGHAPGRPAQPPGASAGRDGRLVSQEEPDLLRHARRCPP